MEEKKKNIRHVLNIIVILFITMLLVSGGTFAYFRWISSEAQQTNLAIQIEENINMHIENPLLTKAGMYPTNTCTNVAATMSGVSIIALENQTGVIARPKFKLRVKITDKDGNVITNNSAGTDNGNNPYRYFINYAVAEENGTCTEPLYSGNFDQNEPTYQGQTQWYDSEWITLTNDSTGFPTISNGPLSGVSFNGAPYQTTYHNYKVWVWIDEEYKSVNTGNVVSDKLQDAKIEVSWSENSSVEQIKAKAYAVYSSDAYGGDDTLRFYQSDKPIEEGTMYSGRHATNVYTGFETEQYSSESQVPWHSHRNLIEKIIFEDVISPISTSYWFSNMSFVSYVDVKKLDTSNVINMESMYNMLGLNKTYMVTIEGMENWNTSKVRNMNNMFNQTAEEVEFFNISDISNWDTSNVTNMNRMFHYTAISALDNWELDLSNWNVSKVTTRESFNFESESHVLKPTWYTSYAIYSADDKSLRFYRTQIDLAAQEEWNDLTVTNIWSDIDNKDNISVIGVSWFDVGNQIKKTIVEDEIYPISTAYWFSSLDNCSYFDISKLNTENAINMSYMFNNAGTGVSGQEITIIGLENLDVSNVTNMSRMFTSCGKNASSLVIGDLSRWNTSNVTDMSLMFTNTAQNSSSLTLNGLEEWNTSNVTNMSRMFEGTGPNASNFSLDLSNWNVSKVVGSTNYADFNKDTETKIIPPNFNS